jgi:hypothetical protein
MSANASGLLARRTGATLAVGSAALHGISLVHAANAAVIVLIGVMIGVCVYCARDLWVRGTLRAWVLVALMNLAMIAVHFGAPTHHHGGATSIAAVHQSTVMTLATALAAVEVLLAVAVVYHRTRRMTPTGTKLDPTGRATRTFPALRRSRHGHLRSASAPPSPGSASRRSPQSSSWS